MRQRTRKASICFALAAGTLSGAQGAAFAEEGGSVLSGPARHANLLKLGYGHFAFQDDSTVVEGDLTPPDATLDVIDTGTIAGSYTRFVGDHFGVELLFGVPFTIAIDGADSIADRGEVATVKALPPTLLFGYYPLGRASDIRPYIAVALNHTIFYDARSSDSLDDLVLGTPDIDLSSSTDVGGFLGVNYRVRDRFHASALAGYVPIDTTADLSTETFFPLADGGQLPLGTIDRRVDVEVNPFVFLGTLGVSF